MRLYIFDLDGTLSLPGHRLHFIRQDPPDWDAFYRAAKDDPVNEPVARIYRRLSYGPGASHDQVWIFSGRSEAVKKDTIWWFRKNHLGRPRGFFMRPDGDYTPDEELKRLWLNEEIRAKGHEVLMVFDDRDKVVKMWREEGIPCCQVAPGDF